MTRKVTGLSLAGAALTLIFHAALSSGEEAGGGAFLAIGVGLFLLLAAVVSLGSDRMQV